MQFEEFKGDKLVEAEGGGSYYSDHYVDWLESQHEQLIDRVKAMAGELSQKQQEEISDFVSELMECSKHESRGANQNGEIIAARLYRSDVELIFSKAVSEYKKFYNHSCEMREQDQRWLRELQSQLANANAELARLKRPAIFRELENAIERYAKAKLLGGIEKEKAEINQLIAKIVENYKE